MFLVFDLETTGLPVRLRGIGSSGYYPPQHTNRYDKSRVVQIAIIGVDRDYNKLYECEFKVKDVDDLMDSTRFHGITEEILERDGVLFKDIITDIKNVLTDCEGFIAHNADFDMNILCSELIRRGYQDIAETIYKKPLYCSMKRFKNEIGIKNAYGIKYPSLTEFYKWVFGTDAEIKNAHDAMGDTTALIECLQEIKNNKNIDILL